MYPYIILIILLSISCVLSYLGKFDNIFIKFRYGSLRKSYHIIVTKGYILYVGICIYLIIFSGFRYYVGTDYWAYIDAYSQLVEGSFYNWHFEIAFLTLMKIIAYFRANYIWFFSIVSAIIIIPIAKRIKERSPYPIFSISLFVLFYFFCSSFNTPRQYIAIAIIVWASKYILSESFWKYCVCVCTATLFHSSAAVFIPLYFMGKVKNNTKTKLARILFLLTMLLFGRQLTTIILGLWPRFSIYIGYESGSAITDFIVQLLLLLLLERIRPNINTDEKKREFELYYNFTFLAIVMSAMAGFNVLFARLEAYFYIFSIIAIPYSIYHLRRNKTLCYFVFLCLGIIICIRYLLNNNCGVVPYELSPLTGF